MTTLDELLQSLPPAERESLVRLGRKYGSTDVLTQANHTLTAYAMGHEVLRQYGFNQEDADELIAARDALQEALSTRDETGIAKKETNSSYTSALKRAKAKRVQAKALFKNLRRVLARRSDDEKAKEKLDITAQKLERSSGNNAELLILQLKAVVALFKEPSVAAVGEARGSDSLLEGLDQLIETLSQTHEARDLRPGSPVQTERIDLLDGFIIEACRAARTAARAADETLGQSAFAREFSLRFLEPAHQPAEKKPE